MTIYLKKVENDTTECTGCYFALPDTRDCLDDDGEVRFWCYEDCAHYIYVQVKPKERSSEN